jgi:hypothetical protein
MGASLDAFFTGHTGNGPHTLHNIWLSQSPLYLNVLLEKSRFDVRCRLQELLTSTLRHVLA